jgi:hypothetical protein
MSEVPARVRVTSLRLDRLGGRGSILEEDLMSFLLEIAGLLRSGAASSTTTFSTCMGRSFRYSDLPHHTDDDRGQGTCLYKHPLTASGQARWSQVKVFEVTELEISDSAVSSP